MPAGCAICVSGDSDFSYDPLGLIRPAPVLSREPTRRSSVSRTPPGPVVDQRWTCPCLALPLLRPHETSVQLLRMTGNRILIALDGVLEKAFGAGQWRVGKGLLGLA